MFADELTISGENKKGSGCLFCCGGIGLGGIDLGGMGLGGMGLGGKGLGCKGLDMFTCSIGGGWEFWLSGNRGL